MREVDLLMDWMRGYPAVVRETMDARVFVPSVDVEFRYMVPDGTEAEEFSRGSLPISAKLIPLMKKHQQMLPFDSIMVLVIPNRSVTKLLPKGKFCVTAGTGTGETLLFNPSGGTSTIVSPGETVIFETSCEWAAMPGANNHKAHLFITRGKQ